jgi:alpha-tubulin suppressor-like RCC1 family protein
LVGSLILAASMAAGACGDGISEPDRIPGPDTPVFRVTVRPEAYVLLVGESKRYSAFVEVRTDCDIDFCYWEQYSGPVSWSSSDKTVATVSGGLVQGRGAGTATITASPDFGSSAQVIATNAVGLQSGTGSASDAIVRVFDSFVPLASVSAGDYHSCARGENGSAYCWGETSFRVFGEDLGEDALPHKVAGGHIFTEMTAGPRHACGIATDGRGMCWGTGAIGFLGRTWVDVPSPINGDYTYISLAAGGEVGPGSFYPFTCGSTTSAVTYCWGANDVGQLGTDSIAEFCSQGQDVFCPNPLPVDTELAFAPIAVSGGQVFASIHAGLDYTCALTGAGEAFCWGRNDRGQLGTGVADVSVHSAPEAVSGGFTFGSVDSGGFTCGVSDGTARCWGDAPDGSLRYGATPASVPSAPSFSSVSVGRSHACGVSNGRGFCWGTNESGQLGSLPDGGRSLIPVAIAGPIQP